MPGHEPRTVPKSAHAPELDNCRLGARHGCQCHHRAELRRGKDRRRAPCSGTDAASLRGGGNQVCSRRRCSSQCAIILIDVAFQRIGPRRKFHINKVVPFGIYLPLPTSKAPPRAGLFYPSHQLVAVIGSQIRIDAHEQPRDSAKHENDRGPLGNFIHSVQLRVLATLHCNYRTYCEHGTDRVQ
jgi:hypothetical protein